MLPPIIFTCLIAYLLVSLKEDAHAQVSGCTVAQAKRADSETDILHSWGALYKWYRAFRHCDDGGIAEGISEDVGRILADRWSTLPEFAQLGRQDARFKKFVIRHIDATLIDDDLKQIQKNAITKCPPWLQDICGELGKEANTALAESGYPITKS